MQKYRPRTLGGNISNYTHIVAVVDRSGSMASCQQDMRGGLDTFFAEQAKEPGKCLVDYVSFDDSYDYEYSNRDVSEAKAVLVPRGMTALNDAIGKTIAGFGAKLASQRPSERPDKVIVVVVTDGHENASKEWTQDKVKESVEHQTDKYNWEFVFLGANIDAPQVGAGYGFARGSSLTFNTKNSEETMASLSAYTATTRSGVAASFSDEDRKAAVGS